jgi:hypothetical protein
MAVSVGDNNRRPRTGTRLSIDSSGNSATDEAKKREAFIRLLASQGNTDSFSGVGRSFAPYLPPRGEAPLDEGSRGDFENRVSAGGPISRVGGRRPSMGMPLYPASSPFSGRVRDMPGPNSPRRPYANLASDPQELTPEEAKTFADYLAQAEALLSTGPDFDIIRNRYRQSAQEGDARLQAMFNQLNSAYAGNAAPIAASYDSAGAAIDESGTRGVANVNAGYDAARNAQSQQLAALGIQDAAAVLAQDGEMAADQGMSAGSISRDAANYAGLNDVNAQSAQQFNTGMQSAAALGGAESRGQLQRSLLDNLAGLAFKESEYADARNLLKSSTAQQLQSGEQVNQEAIAKFLADQNQINYENSFQQSRARNEQLQWAVEQTGSIEEALALLQELQAAGISF